MAGLIYRIIIAIVVVLFAFAAIPLILSLLQLDPPAAALTLVKLCIGVLAVLYILFGSWPPGSPFA